MRRFNDWHEQPSANSKPANTRSESKAVPDPAVAETRAGSAARAFAAKPARTAAGPSGLADKERRTGSWVAAIDPNRHGGSVNRRYLPFAFF